MTNVNRFTSFTLDAYHPVLTQLPERQLAMGTLLCVEGYEISPWKDLSPLERDTKGHGFGLTLAAEASRLPVDQIMRTGETSRAFCHLMPTSK